nr:ureidoglycolate hydrolase, putative [Tanacetum cinerariifolium]
MKIESNDKYADLGSPYLILLHHALVFKLSEAKFLKLNQGTWHAGPLFKPSTMMDLYNLKLCNTNVFKISGVKFLKLKQGTWHAGPLYKPGTMMDFYNLELSNTNIPAAKMVFRYYLFQQRYHVLEASPSWKDHFLKYVVPTTYSAPSNSKTGSHRSGNVIEDVLQSFVADTEQEQQLAYADFE